MATPTLIKKNRLYKSSNQNEDVTFRNFCLGDCSSLDTYLNSKHTSIWLVPKYFNALFRGIGQAALSNNPFSGALILIGFLYYNVTMAIYVLMCTTVAIFTAMIAKLDTFSISSGYISFNAALIACITSAIFTSKTPLYNQPLDMKVTICMIVGTIISVLLTNSLTNILSSFKPSLPILSIPFHIVTFSIFACVRPTELHSTLQNDTDANVQTQKEFADASNSTNADLQLYSWETTYKVLFAAVMSGGQLLGVPQLLNAVIIYTALFLCSPILTAFSYLGAVIGTLIGLALTQFPNEDVFSGGWGYNGLLTCGIVGLFYIFNRYSFMVGVCGAIFAAIVQLVLLPTFAYNRIPILALPFVISSLLFVSVTSTDNKLVRAPKITYPELQLKMDLQEVKPKPEHEICIV